MGSSENALLEAEGMSRMHCAPRVPGRAGEWQFMMTSDCVLQYVALNTSAIGINRSVCMLWFLERQVMPCAHSSGVLWDSILGFIFSHQKLPYFTSRVTPRFGCDQLCAPPVAVHRECGDIPLVCRLDTAPCPCGMLWVLLESGSSCFRFTPGVCKLHGEGSREGNGC